jgi:hypothetical protein
MNALRRVARVPFLVGGVWVLHLVLAAAFGSLLHASAVAATEPHSALPDGRDLFHLAELLDAEKSLAVLGLGGAFGSMLAAIVVWIFVSPIVIARLDGRSVSESIAIGIRSIPAVAVQTVWHGGLRLVALFLVLMVIGPAPGAAKVLLLCIALGGCALALDLVRVQVTLHEASRFHVRSALFAFVRTFTDARFLAAGVGLYAVQMFCAAAMVLTGLHSIGDGSTLWAARLLSGVAVVAGLLRLAFVVERGEVTLVKQPRERD